MEDPSEIDWNQKFKPDVIDYMGTALLGNCLEILGRTSEFVNYSIAQQTFLNSLATEGYSYFSIRSEYSTDDLLNQYLAINYLERSGKLSEFKAMNEYDGFLTNLLMSMFWLTCA